MTSTTVAAILPFPGGTAEALSPSLLPRSGGTAYELKFLLRPDQAERAADWARRHLAFDPHADAALGGAYRVHTLYLDTPQWDVYQRSPSYRRHKFRLRRYGDDPAVFLERKTKSGDRVAKRRTPVTDAELARLADADADPSWAAHWFHRRLLARRLQPACQISYERVAHVDAGADGRCRLTLDRHLRCLPADGWRLGDAAAGLPLLAGEAILELKFAVALPGPFKRLVELLALTPSKVSKYRLGVQAWGLAAGGKEVG